MMPTCSYVLIASLAMTQVVIGDDHEVAESAAVLERAIEAMGGRAAIESIESVRFILSQDDDPASKFVYWAAPDRFLMVSRFDSVAQIIGFDGERFWDHYVREEDIHLRTSDLLWWAERYRASTEYHRLLVNMADSPGLVPETRRGHLQGRPVIRVRVVNESGRADTVSLCESSLELLQLEILQRGVEDPQRARSVTTFEDWRQMGPIRLFERVSVRFDGSTSSYALQASFDGVDPDMFMFPNDVLAASEKELEIIRREDSFLERIAEMDREELVEELGEIAIKRSRVRETRGEEELIRRFASTMERLRLLDEAEEVNVKQQEDEALD